MWQKVVDIAEWLKEPELVASFQKICGVVTKGHKCGHKHKIYDRYSENGYVSAAVKGRSDCNGDVVGNSCHYEVNQNARCKCLDHSSSGFDRQTSVSDLSRREVSSDVSDCASDTDQRGDTPDYYIDNKFFYYLFLFSAGLGNELFYASFFPIWFWNVDGSVGRRVLLVWVFVMYFGQAAKDIICWPRPASPPVARIEKRYALEYGMPSTHAMVGAAIPFSLLMFTMNRYEYDTCYAVVIAITWCTMVCLSRLYMGMHSVLDVIAGLVLVSLLMLIYLPLVDTIDQFQLTSPYSPLGMVILPILMAVFYPKLDRWSTARGDTIVVLGSGAGMSFGYWLNYQLGILKEPLTPPPYTIIWPTFHGYGLMLLRASIGIVILVATRAILKTLTYTITCYVLNVRQSDSKHHQSLSVELPIKFFTYMGIGISVVYLSPQIFHILNISRETWYTEV